MKYAVRVPPVELNAFEENEIPVPVQVFLALARFRNPDGEAVVSDHEPGSVRRQFEIGDWNVLSDGGSEDAKPADPPKPKAAKPAPAAAKPEPEPEPEPVVSAPAPVVRRSPPAIRDATQPRAPGAPTPEEEAARATLAEIEKIAKRIDLLDLTERTCKWPIGDPTDDDFAFCGLDAVPGKPYCQYHVAVAFQPMSSRRDRRR